MGVLSGGYRMLFMVRKALEHHLLSVLRRQSRTESNGATYVPLSIAA